MRTWEWTLTHFLTRPPILTFSQIIFMSPADRREGEKKLGKNFSIDCCCCCCRTLSIFSFERAGRESEKEPDDVDMELKWNERRGKGTKCAIVKFRFEEIVNITITASIVTWLVFFLSPLQRNTESAASFTSLEFTLKIKLDDGGWGCRSLRLNGNSSGLSQTELEMNQFEISIGKSFSEGGGRRCGVRSEREAKEKLDFMLSIWTCTRVGNRLQFSIYP